MSGAWQLVVHLKHMGSDGSLGMPGLPRTAVKCVLESERCRADPGSAQQREKSTAEKPQAICV